MSATAYLESQLITAVLDNTAYTGPATLYLALFDADETELSGAGYSRETVAFDITGSSAVNSAAVVFGAATADWTAARYWRVMDASTGGNALFAGQFTSDQTVKEDSTLEFAEGNIEITFS